VLQQQPNAQGQGQDQDQDQPPPQQQGFMFDLSRAPSMSPGQPLAPPAAEGPPASAPASARSSASQLGGELLQGLPNLSINTQPRPQEQQKTSMDDADPFEAFGTPLPGTPSSAGSAPGSSASHWSFAGFSPGSGSSTTGQSPFAFSPTAHQQALQQRPQPGQQQQPGDLYSFGQGLELSSDREPTFEDNFTIKACPEPSAKLTPRRSLSQLIFGNGANKGGSSSSLQFPLLDPLASLKPVQAAGSGAGLAAVACGALLVAAVLQAIGLEALASALLPSFVHVPLIRLARLLWPSAEAAPPAAEAAPAPSADDASLIILQAMESASASLQQKEQEEAAELGVAGVIRQRALELLQSVREEPEQLWGIAAPCVKIAAVVLFALLSHYAMLQLHARVHRRQRRLARAAAAVAAGAAPDRRSRSSKSSSNPESPVKVSSSSSSSSASIKKQLHHHHHHHFHQGALPPASQSQSGPVKASSKATKK
jgi:hypothetical protein